MYCAKCGTQGEAGHTVCVKCGTPLSDHPYQAPRAPLTTPPTGAAASGNSPYAGFWVRAAAFVIDYLILIIVMVVISAVVRGAVGPSGALVTFLGLLLMPWLYYSIFETSDLQATPGKLALGLKVTNEAGDPLGFGPATGRFFGKLVTNLTFGFGYAMVVFTDRRQTLHDKMAGALVVLRRYPSHEIWSAGPAPKVSPAIAVLAVLGLVFLGPGGIGILAAIAIPAYQDYTIRAQVTEGLNLATPYKAAIAEAVANGRTFAALSTENLQLAPRPAKYVNQIEVTRGVIVIHYGAAANRLIAGQSLSLVPGVKGETEIVWVCGYQPAPPGVTLAMEHGSGYTTLAPKYLPRLCRETPYSAPSTQ